MPTINLNTTSIGAGVRYYSAETDIDYVVQSHVIVQSFDNSAFALFGNNHSVTVQGLVIGRSSGVYLGDNPSSTGLLVQVDGSGTLVGSTNGATLDGSGTVANKGEIWGGASGLRIFGSSVAEVVIDNDGTIQGGAYGILRGNVGGITQMGAVRLTNDGVIHGRAFSYSDDTGNGSGVDLITNRGRMIGDVELGFYNDLFDNVAGTVRGEIYGEAGDDTIRPGAGAERIYGGADIDTLDFRSGAGLRVDLQDADGSGNTGRAKNDSYEAIEAIRGSRTGNDTLRGDGEGNQLYGEGGSDLLEGRSGDDELRGGAGNDRLRGGAGVDILQGGAGVDTLSGGTQVDAFSFTNPGSSGDRITDFEKGTDVLFIARSGFGADLALGLLSASRFRLDGAPLDSNDRFVFRASDDTLWFDPDGSGRAARVLIADFQTNLTLAASDLQVV